jgi:hypothetical protein
VCHWPRGSRVTSYGDHRAKPQLFQVLVREIRKDAEVNTMFQKTVGVLGHAEFFEPVRNLLHRGHQRSRSWPGRVFNRGNREFTPTGWRWHVS